MTLSRVAPRTGAAYQSAWRTRVAPSFAHRLIADIRTLDVELAFAEWTGSRSIRVDPRRCAECAVGVVPHRREGWLHRVESLPGGRHPTRSRGGTRRRALCRSTRWITSSTFSPTRGRTSDSSRVCSTRVAAWERLRGFASLTCLFRIVQSLSRARHRRGCMASWSSVRRKAGGCDPFRLRIRFCLCSLKRWSVRGRMISCSPALAVGTSTRRTSAAHSTGSSCETR